MEKYFSISVIVTAENLLELPIIALQNLTFHQPSWSDPLHTPHREALLILVVHTFCFSKRSQKLNLPCLTLVELVACNARTWHLEDL